jgi:hypothetical protein
MAVLQLQQQPKAFLFFQAINILIGVGLVEKNADGNRRGGVFFCGKKNWKFVEGKLIFSGKSEMNLLWVISVWEGVWWRLGDLKGKIKSFILRLFCDDDSLICQLKFSLQKTRNQTIKKNDQPEMTKILTIFIISIPTCICVAIVLQLGF